MKILILGATGMLGHVVDCYFREKGYDVYATSRKNGDKYYFDAEKDIMGIQKVLDSVRPDVVVNCVGILNRDAEEHHAKATLINSYLPHYLDELQNDYDFKLVHISTDCVFEGTKGDYDETSQPDATSFYGRSKALGEVINDRAVTLRTSIVGPDNNPNAIGLFKWFINQKNAVYGYSKVIWTGVTTIELAKAIEVAIRENLTGLHHVVNNDSICKRDLLILFRQYFCKEIEIKENNMVESKKTLVRTQASFPFQVPDYETMIKEMRDWVLEHSERYHNIFESCGLGEEFYEGNDDSRNTSGDNKTSSYYKRIR